MLYLSILILHYRLFLLLFCSVSEVNVIILVLQHQKWPFWLIYTKVYVDFYFYLTGNETGRGIQAAKSQGWIRMWTPV